MWRRHRGLRPPGPERLLPSGARDRVPLPGVRNGEQFREVVTVTRHHKTIQGVRTTVVHDVLRRLDGTLAERTNDWYATDDSATSGTSERRPPPTTGVAASRTGRAPGSPVSAVDGAASSCPHRPSDECIPAGVRPGHRRGPGLDRPAPRPGHGAVRGRPGRASAASSGRASSRACCRPRSTHLASASCASVTCREETRRSIWSRSPVTSVAGRACRAQPEWSRQARPAGVVSTGSTGRSGLDRLDQPG